MNKLFVSKKAKSIIDYLLLLGLIVVGVCSKLQGDYTNIWTSLHCISSMVWCLLIIAHIAQHWKLIKAFTKRKVIIRNKITALTILSVIIMFLSIILFIIKVDFYSLHFHGIVGRLFTLMVIVHLIDKWKMRK